MVEYSGFWRRAVARFIDGIILYIPTLVIGVVSKSIVFNLVFGIIIAILYYPIFESSALSGTPGKALMKIAVLSESGQIITFKQSLVRYFCQFLSTFLLMAGYLMQPFTSKKQTLHDMIAETIVIKRPPPEVNFFTVWKAQFDFIMSKL